MIKNFPYEDIDGKHWPDAAYGSAEYYSVDLYQYLSQENDSMTEVLWEIPATLTGSDAFEDETTAYIKIAANNRGSHRITFKLKSVEAGKEQLTVIPIILKVY